MRFVRTDKQFVRISECGQYQICANYPDLYTPWVRVGDKWEHIDGRGCDTAREAAEVCVRHSEGRAAA